MNHFFVIALVMGVCAAQRPHYAGTRPIGRPGLASRFKGNNTDSDSVTIANRINSDNGATNRIPIDAKGDRDLVDRLNQWPREHQPFWLLNADHIEAARNRSPSGSNLPGRGGFDRPDTFNGNGRPEFGSNGRPESGSNGRPEFGSNGRPEFGGSGQPEFGSNGQPDVFRGEQPGSDGRRVQPGFPGTSQNGFRGSGQPDFGSGFGGNGQSDFGSGFGGNGQDERGFRRDYPFSNQPRNGDRSFDNGNNFGPLPNSQRPRGQIYPNLETFDENYRSGRRSVFK